MSQHSPLLTVVGDYMLPETLAKVAKCSKVTHQAITPLLEKKMQCAKEVRQLVLRLFPTITNMPEVAEMENKTQHYRTILDKYFSPIPNTEPCEIEISHAVGCMISDPNPFIERHNAYMLYVPGGVDTAIGRSRVLKAIGDWIAILQRRQERGVHSYGGFERLDALANAILTDFTMLEDTVESDVRGRFLYLR
jgi:hypothetical protein